MAVVLLLAVVSLAFWVTSSARLERADLVINNGTEISSLDPATVTGVPESRVMYSLFEGLTVKHPETLAPLPGMAESWELSPDGRTYTFHIRPEARWNNGDSLTAQDFEWSWRRTLSPETASEYSYLLWYVKGAQSYNSAPDDCLYDTQGGTWVQDLGNGRVRVGLHGGVLDAPEQAGAALALELAEGAQLAQGDALLSLGELAVTSPVTGVVRAVHREAATSTEGLLVDPYEAGWLVELEVADGALAGAGLRSAEEAREAYFWPRVGADAVDERTFVVELHSATPFFIHLVSFYPTFPVHRGTIERARREHPDTWQIEWVRAENIVTNGPFRIAERRVNDRIRLRKNPLYWDAANVALESIDILAVEHYGTMLNLYLTGEVDWIDKVSPILTPRLREREDFQPRPYLGTYFFRVNVLRPPFDDVRVRRALALAIDRRAICEKVTKKGEQPNWSLCPGGLSGYPRPEMKHAPVGANLEDYDAAFAEDCAEAARLLAQAGFGEGGRPFPTFEIHYNTAETHRDIAEVMADTWKRVLGVDAKLLNQEWKVYLDTQTTRGYDISRSAWIGDYPDPNTFVDLFVTDGDNNRTGWGNPRYDELVRLAGMELDANKRLDYLAQAETILLEELPIFPIYNYVSQNMVNPRLGGFFENVQDDHYPKFWYWMSDEELAEKRAAQPADWETGPAPGPARGRYAPARADGAAGR